MPARRASLADQLGKLRPELGDPVALITAGHVRVDGAIITNPDSQVLPTQSIKVAADVRPRGVQKLGHALDALGVPVAGRVCVDVGACTGGFTLALLERGAARVYAVDIGYGQLLGSLRQDPRVVNLERTNAGDLDDELVPDDVDLVVADVTKVPLAEVVPQVTAGLALAAGCELVALVKPMFELGRGALPTTEAELDEAVQRATAAAVDAGWTDASAIRSAMLGSRGAVELFVHARMAARSPSVRTSR